MTILIKPETPPSREGLVLVSTRGDAIKHRVREAREIERMPFFRKDQTNLSPEDRIYKDRWLEIIDERIEMLPVTSERGTRGRAQLNCKAWMGEETGDGDYPKKGAI